MSKFSSKGFTLLEIMIALAIIGGLLITVLSSLNYHIGIAERHEIITMATMLARSKLLEIEEIPAATTGDFPEPYNRYHYITGVKDSPYPGILEISVIVSNGRENIRFTEFIQNPALTGKPK